MSWAPEEDKLSHCCETCAMMIMNWIEGTLNPSPLRLCRFATAHFYFLFLRVSTSSLSEFSFFFSYISGNGMHLQSRVNVTSNVPLCLLYTEKTTKTVNVTEFSGHQMKNWELWEQKDRFLLS